MRFIVFLALLKRPYKRLLGLGVQKTTIFQVNSSIFHTVYHSTLLKGGKASRPTKASSPSSSHNSSIDDSSGPKDRHCSLPFHFQYPLPIAPQRPTYATLPTDAWHEQCTRPCHFFCLYLSSHLRPNFVVVMSNRDAFQVTVHSHVCNNNQIKIPSKYRPKICHRLSSNNFIILNCANLPDLGNLDLGLKCKSCFKSLGFPKIHIQISLPVE